MTIKEKLECPMEFMRYRHGELRRTSPMFGLSGLASTAGLCRNGMSSMILCYGHREEDDERLDKPDSSDRMPRHERQNWTLG